MKEKKTVGIITIHGIDNFGSLLQAYATQEIISQLGYMSEIIDYKYPNAYHLEKAKQKSPYAEPILTFTQRVQQHFYHKYCSKKVNLEKHKLYDAERDRLLRLSQNYKSKEELFESPPL